MTLSTSALPFAARTCHAWLVRLARARGVSLQRVGKALFADFWYFSSLKSAIKEKLLYVSRGRTLFDPCLGDADTHAPRMCQFPYLRAKVTSIAKIKDICFPRFFFCICRRKRKSYQKENAVRELSRSAERDEDSSSSTSQAFEKA